ncbi:MAG: ribonuclease R, partial [Nitrospinota bacterium]
MKVKHKNDLLLELKKILSRPLSLGEIKRKISDAYIKNLAHNLKLLAKGGDIVKIRGGRYGFADDMNLVVGTVQGHPDGYGFVIPEDPKEDKDVFIGHKNFGTVMHGDRVVCRVEKADAEGRLEGNVIRILQRAHETLTGVFESRGRGGIVVPTQKRITHTFRIPPGKTARAKGGQIVVARITAYPEKLQTPAAEIVELLGYPTDPQVERKIIMRQYELPESFPPAVENAARKIKEPA